MQRKGTDQAVPFFPLLFSPPFSPFSLFSFLFNAGCLASSLRHLIPFSNRPLGSRNDHIGELLRRERMPVATRLSMYHRGMRLRSRLTLLLGLLCASAPVLFQQDRRPADTNRDNDAQAIYSWLITHSADQDKLYLIAPETSQSDYTDRCLEVPPDHAADFRQIRADFDRSKIRFAPDTVLYFTTRTVPTFFSTTKPYVILDPNVAKEIMLHSAWLPDSPIVRERYPAAEHLLIFSDVFFNQKRTVALVHVNWWCGGLCGRPMWIALEKGDDGVWQVRPWARNCFVFV